MVSALMKIQQDKMVLIFLTVDVFGSLNMEVDAVFSTESASVFIFFIQMYS